MIFEFRQYNSGGTNQKGMPVAVFVVADYAHEANKLFEQNDGYFGHRDGDELEAKRWEPVEQADGFEDDIIMEIVTSHMTEGQKLWRSGTFVVDKQRNELEEFWIVRNV